MTDQHRRKLSLPRKPKAWSHQDELDALIGKKIVLTTINTKTALGELVEADRFTIKVRQSVNDEFPAIYFKSALVSIAKR